jgi:hypothetical protein
MNMNTRKLLGMGRTAVAAVALLTVSATLEPVNAQYRKTYKCNESTNPIE